MARQDLDVHFAKIANLVFEINTMVPPDSAYRTVQFRADLAGLLVVAMAATYETCVKDVLFDHANRCHLDFGEFARRNYKKLNSRISVNDLKNYCELFDPRIKQRFQARLSSHKKSILERTGKNIELSYEQILAWRHEFAHAGNRNTTIEEATKTHTLAKRVIYLFADSFTRSGIH